MEQPRRQQLKHRLHTKEAQLSPLQTSLQLLPTARVGSKDPAKTEALPPSMELQLAAMLLIDFLRT